MWYMIAYSTSKDWALFREASELLQDCKNWQKIMQIKKVSDYAGLYICVWWLERSAIRESYMAFWSTMKFL